MKNETPLTDFKCINDIKILSNSTISVVFFFCYNLHMESMPLYKKKQQNYQKIKSELFF